MDIDENKLVQSLKEAFVPMFERIENRLDNIEAKVENIETRVENIETRVENIETRVENIETKVENSETDIHEIKLQIETYVIPALNAQNEGRHILLEKQEEISEKIDDMREDIINLQLKSEFPGRRLIEKI